MSTMLDKLAANEEEIEVKGVKIKLRSLKVPDVVEFMKLSEKDINQAFDFLLFRILRSSIPTPEEDAVEGVSDEELRKFMKNEMDGFAAISLVNKVQELSGLAPEKKLLEAGGSGILKEKSEK